MKILFLDQSGKLGGAELSLLDIANAYREDCCVALLETGPFKAALQKRHIPVQILKSGRSLIASKQANWRESAANLRGLIPLVQQVAELSRSYDILYANTPKALVVGALASYLSGCPLVYHLRDIISPDHFSYLNRWLLITLASQRASLVIANSEATRQAFIQAGGKANKAKVVYNGFELTDYETTAKASLSVRQNLRLEDRFIVGHFSRLAPWKGQHILLEALAQCPDNITALLVGDALFGEQDYVKALHQEVEALGLEERVQFLGFRSDIPELMAACNVVAHTSTAPEPFGRVIVEAMLVGRPIIAAAAGGVVELVDHGQTGWLCRPGDAQELAQTIIYLAENPTETYAIALKGQALAQERFYLQSKLYQLDELLGSI